MDSMDVHLSEGGLTTADKVHKREEFRLLISDVQDLPETQRTALLLREIDALSYEQIAEAMETTVPSVKSLLVRARVSLAEAAEARQLSCEEVREELGEVAEGLKRTTAPVRRHLRSCDRCQHFRKQLRATNRALAALYPVGPLLLLKKALLAHLGGTGAASGGTAAAAGGAAAASSAGAGAALQVGFGAVATQGRGGARRGGDRHRRCRRGPARRGPAHAPPHDAGQRGPAAGRAGGHRRPGHGARPGRLRAAAGGPAPRPRQAARQAQGDRDGHRERDARRQGDRQGDRDADRRPRRRQHLAAHRDRGHRSAGRRLADRLAHADDVAAPARPGPGRRADRAAGHADAGPHTDRDGDARADADADRDADADGDADAHPGQLTVS